MPDRPLKQVYSRVAADMLNKYFASQCSLDEANHDLPQMHHTHTNSLQSIHITPEEVIDSNKCLK
ncbi:hypothetical protein DPMN_105236, partial [Dreissena polymorpha]